MKKIFLLLTMALFCFTAVDAKIKVHTIGDSTMADYDESSSDKRGWCQYLQSFFDEAEVIINNCGKPGADSRQFYLTSGLWPSVKSQMSAGDYLLIQFAHNDEGTVTYGTDNLELAAYYQSIGSNELGTEKRGTNPQTTYREYLRKFIDEARELGVTPVLVGPICRKYFQGNTIKRSGQHDLGDKFWKLEGGKLLKDQNLPADDLSMSYTEAMRIVAEEEKVTFIDLTAATRDLYLEYGETGCADLFCKDDNTHLQTMGASVIGRLGASLLKDAGILADHITIPTELTAAPKTLDLGETYAGIQLQKEILLTGFGLTPAAGEVTITASANLQVSTDKATYGATAKAAYTSGNLFQRIYVKAQYSASGAQSDEITITDGTTTVKVPVTATIVSLEGGTAVSATWAMADKATVANATVVGPIEAELTLMNMMAADTKADFTDNGAAATLVRLHNSNATGGKVDWPGGEIDENASRFVDFAITAPTNAEIRITKISMKLASHSTATMNCHVNIGVSDNMNGIQTICEKKGMSNKSVYTETFNPTVTIPAGDIFHVRVLPWHENASASTGKYIALKDVVIEGMAFETEAVTKYTVSFNNNGHGATVESEDRLALPNPLPELTEEGWVFGGWYTDEALTTPAVAGATISANTTLYAKWTEREKFTVIYENNGHGTAPESITVYELPALPTLTEEGWIFGGWYTDAELTTKAVKGAAVTAAMTLYAKWIEDEVPEAGSEVVATWDFRDADAACASTSIERTTGKVQSDVTGIELDVDATNGKLKCTAGQHAQFNQGTIIRVPTISAKDEVTVITYRGYGKYCTIDGVEMASDSVTVKAKGAGSCIVEATTGGSYLYCIRVKQVTPSEDEANLKEVVLYATDFQNWDKVTYSATPTTKTVQTKSGDITFTIVATEVNPTGTNSKFTNTEVITTGYMMAAKNPGQLAAEAYIETSVIPSVTTVSYVHAATGGSRGWGLQYRREGQEEWITVHDAYCQQAGEKVTVTIDRKNVQLRWYNLSANQNAYMTEMTIKGNIEVVPRTFKDFELNFMNITEMPAKPEGVISMEGTLHDAQHGTNSDLRLVVPVDGPVKFTFGGCTYSNTDAKVLDKTGKELASIDVKSPGCYPAGQAEWTYNVEEADTLTIIGAQYTPYLKAEACDYVASVAITYFDQNDKVLGKTEVSPVEPLTFAYTAADLTIAEGYAFRGWTKADGTKLKEGTAPGAELKLYALVTPIEKAVLGAHYDYDFTKTSFYPEDHECIIATEGGAYHNNHGWYFKAEGKIEVAVAGNAYLQMTLCQYSAEADIVVTAKSTGETVATVPGMAATDGATQTIFYSGEADTLVLTFKGQNYFHKLSIYNVQEKVERNEAGYYELAAGDGASLLLVLMQLQKGDKVFLPNGLYDFGETVLTQISVDSVSIIGESMEGTIIRNAPDASMESINNTATLLLTGNGTYFQDLTIQNALDYYKNNNGRAVTLWDKGDGTICKNVRLLSYQDTYYSNKPGQKLYWENGAIHGTVDYICGSGTVYFNEVLLFCEKRASNGGGSDCITASNSQTASGDKGYIFESCTIQSECPTVSLSRAWNDQPQVIFLNTVMDQSAGNFTLTGNGIQRWTIAGMNNCDPHIFGEYNSVDTEGNVVSPESNKVKFTSTNSPEMETILSADRAAEYTYEKVLGTWNPKAETAQTELTYKDGKWNVTEGIFLVSQDGQTVITSTLPTELKADMVVRAANGRGGFGPAAILHSGTTSVENVEMDNMQVRKVFENGTIYIIRGAEKYSIDGQRVM